MDRLYSDHLREAITKLHEKIRSTKRPSDDTAASAKPSPTEVAAPKEVELEDWNRALEMMACAIEAFLAARLRQPSMELDPKLHAQLQRILLHSPIGSPLGQLPIIVASDVSNEVLANVVKYLRDLQTLPHSVAAAEKARLTGGHGAAQEDGIMVRENPPRRLEDRALRGIELSRVGDALPPAAWDLLKCLESCTDGQAPECEIPRNLLDADLLRICDVFGVVTPCGVRLISRYASYDSGPKYGITELGRTLLSMRRLSPAPHVAVATSRQDEGNRHDNGGTVRGGDLKGGGEGLRGDDIRRPSPQGTRDDRARKQENARDGSGLEGDSPPASERGESPIPSRSEGETRLPAEKQKIVDAVLKKLRDDQRATLSRSDLKEIGLPPQSVDNHWGRTGQDGTVRSGGGAHLDDVGYCRDFVTDYVQNVWSPRLRREARPSQTSQTWEDQSEGSDEAADVA